MSSGFFLGFFSKMCGIIGYIGPKVISSVLLVGLHKLEYRGYDSAGLAVLEKDELIIKKTPGKIASLEEAIKNQIFDGSCGIGHTRWATHGEPNALNAHPHCNTSKKISVVHNGIIENFFDLKNELIDHGYVFISETDTEVIPHLIDKFKNNGHETQVAFHKTLQKLEGKFAISMISEDEPNRMYFARNGASLIIAQNIDHEGNLEGFISSDLPAIIPIAKNYHYLQDGEWGYFDTQRCHYFDWDGKPKEQEFKKLELTLKNFDKGDYPHFMLKEIYEQPKVIENILKKRVNDQNEVFFDDMLLTPEYLFKVGQIIIQACGTSLNAGLVGKIYLENHSKIHTNADFSSEFRYRNPVLGGDTLVVGISQSGETADTLAGLHSAKSKFLKVISFLNNEESTMARDSDAVIALHAGQEIGVASTKAYIAEVVNLFLFSIYLGGIKWTLPKKEKETLIDELRKLPEKISLVLENIDSIREIANYLKEVSDTIFLGRFHNYPTALEGALKLKELSYIHASGYAAGEFKHGPIALVTKDVPVVVIVPYGDLRTKMISNLLEVKARQGKIISIISEGDDQVKKMSDYFIEIPHTPEYLSPILSAVPLQLLAYYTAIYRGCDVDQPRNLAKSVTVE